MPVVPSFPSLANSVERQAIRENAPGEDASDTAQAHPLTGAVSRQPSDTRPAVGSHTPQTRFHRRATSQSAFQYAVFSGPWRRVRQRVRWLFSPSGRDARQQLGILFRLLFTGSQIVIITIILSLSVTIFHVATDSGRVTEWEACTRPLGIWSALWAGRAVLSGGMNIWEWKRHLAKKQRVQQRISDTESNHERRAARYEGAQVAWAPEVRAPPQSLVGSGESDEEPMPSGPALAQLAPVTRPRISEASHGPLARATRESDRDGSGRFEGTTTSSDAAFDKCDTFLTVLALAHFVGNHYLLYTSVHTCRVEAPHVWWLAFGIVSLGYIIVLELLLIAFVVFILGPVLLLILNLLMLCMGRPYDRHGNVQLRPEIPKLELRWIDQIPLAVYIPPPSEDVEIQEEELQDMSSPSSRTLDAGSDASPAQTGLPAPVTASPSPKRGLKFWQSKAPSVPKTPGTLPAGDSAAIDDDPRFEKSAHPFVVLERTRATCPICLTDFVEPNRRPGIRTVRKPIVEEEGPSDVEVAEETVVAEPTSEVKADGGLSASSGAKDTTEDEAGAPGEPLRLLACGHAFHKHCLDPWLSTVSGRCPVCSQKVDVPEKKTDGPSAK